MNFDQFSARTAAFPSTGYDNNGLVKHTECQTGMSIRFYIATAAMQGLLAGIYSSKEMLNEFMRFKKEDAVIENAIRYADELIKALEKGER